MIKKMCPQCHTWGEYLKEDEYYCEQCGQQLLNNYVFIDYNKYRASIRDAGVQILPGKGGIYVRETDYREFYNKIPETDLLFQKIKVPGTHSVGDTLLLKEPALDNAGDVNYHTYESATWWVKKGKENNVICTHCGGSDVSCPVIINPNTGKVINMMNPSYYEGFCHKCGGVILSNVNETLVSIEKEYIKCIETNSEKPLYADCIVAYNKLSTEDINTFTTFRIGLCASHNQKKKRVDFHCWDFKEFVSLTRFQSPQEIIILHCNKIY